MKIKTPAIALVLILVLSACSSGGGGGGPFNKNAGPAETVDVTQLPSMRVVGVMITVPETLTVSEADTYKPKADIVWRGDPYGDRYAQIKAIFEDGIGRGVRALQGDLPVVVHIEVRKFHALTERTRYSFGGTHAIDFLLSVTNGRTGEVIIPPYLVSSKLRGYGGDQALAAEHIGLTQKIRITAHLAALIQQELTGIATPPASGSELEI